MQTILLQAAQTRTGAALEILIMLIGAAAIGAITVYYYWRAIHRKKLTEKDSSIASLESSKEQLDQALQKSKSEIAALTSQLTNKVSDLDNQKTRYNELYTDSKKWQEEIANLKGMYDESVREVDALKSQLKIRDEELREADEILARIAERKKSIDYDSIGQADEAEKDDLMMISGIGPFIAQRLNALDIYTFEQISHFTKKDIKDVNKAIEYFPGRIERDEWVAQAKELVHSNGEKTDLLQRISQRKDKINYDRIGIAHKEDADDLTTISGIGGWIQKKLNALDIYTFQQIANFTLEDENGVTEALEYFPGRIDRDEWVPQAQELVHSGGKKTALFERLKRRKDKIDYSKIGLAHPEEADDLTEIKGIGEFIQEKLNVLDIYTFQQISRFTEQDIETVTDVIEHFPGRIQRDNWVDQSKELSQQRKLELT